MSEHYLGIDLGSSYTKIAVVDSSGSLMRKDLLPTLSRNRNDFDNLIDEVRNNFEIKRTCATGYGRKFFAGDMQKTELICVSAGVNALYQVEKEIIDIGGEDIKIIVSSATGSVESFHMNDKCSAGTGTFITEIADKAELEIAEMDSFARGSKSDRTINSFCTVFAKTEILGWKFDGVPIEAIARGIYLSIVDRICKMPILDNRPVYLCGGVIEYHPYLKGLLEEKIESEVYITENPQYMVALGAAILAMKSDQAVKRSVEANQ